jgi:hypothetical protein
MHDDDASGGYVTGVDYLPGYFAELNPVRVGFVLLLNGYAGPPPGPCCELGFGQGVSLAMHAAAGAERLWWGTDFNVSHAQNANLLLQAAGVAAHAEAQSFAEFCRRDDLPQFAFIGLHGVWSWVSHENRELIADFLRRRLLPGGVAYVSYNTLAGWATMMPVRHLLLEHTRWMSAPGRPEIAKAQAAVDFASRVFGLDPGFARGNQRLGQRMEELGRRASEYVVHEYLNREWHPLPFAQTAEVLQAAGLDYAGDALPHQRVPLVHVSAEQQVLLDEIENPVFRETVRDLFCDRHFRCDLWLRGARRLTRRELLPQLEAAPVVLGVERGSSTFSAVGAAGEVELEPAAVGAVLQLLREADAAVPMGELLDRLCDQDIELESALAMVAVLVSCDAVLPAQAPAATSAACAASARLNAYQLSPKAQRARVTHLASPVTGGAITLPATQHAFLAAHLAGRATPEQLIEHVWDHLADNEDMVTRDGKPVTERAEALDILRPFAHRLQDQWLPALRRLQVIGR